MNFIIYLLSDSMDFLSLLPLMENEAAEGGGGGSGGSRVGSRVPRASALASKSNLQGIIKSTARKKRFSLAPYTDDIVKYNNLRYPPAKIAEILCLEHDLDPKIMNRKAVKSRLRYVKKNSLKTLAPTNTSGSLRAVDDPNSVCMFHFFIFNSDQYIRAESSRCNWYYPHGSHR